MFDTSLGYPAATFSGSGTIVGRTYPLRDQVIDRCLEILDEEEGTVAGLYERLLITTGRGVPAWAYEYGTGLTLTPIASGDWIRHRGSR